MKNLINEIWDVIIIGSGPGGMTAAIYTARAGLKTLIIEKEAPGGKMIKTDVIENYPGFKSIKGPELSINLYNQAVDLGTEYTFEEIEEITKNEQTKLFSLKTKKNFNDVVNTYQAKTVIIATGMKENQLGVIGEDRLYGRGVSYCAVCDGAFYKGKNIAVVGGGYSAIEEGTYLTRFAKNTYLIHRRQQFRADQKHVDKFKQKDGVHFILDSIVEEIYGEKRVEGIKIRNNITNELTDLKVDGIFPYVGATPITKFLEINFAKILSDDKFIKTDNKMETEIFGLFAIGDVRVTPLRQIATAIGDGALAGQQVIELLQNEE
ncbi:thioredoxin-disulfide reductase [Spiroplasma endosymbiont of Labia minor]|uniref:thioredoxin-disulfide reductase n=1 Tax=Spiroplasma endosymbiont of Labia minor TaxID=3066305 RepID=UPI0030D3AD45